VYASFHIPLSDKVNLRLNAGAYTGSGESWNLGATAAVGIEVKRFYVGVNYFQNCVNDRDLKLGLSVGYKQSSRLIPPLGSPQYQSLGVFCFLLVDSIILVVFIVRPACGYVYSFCLTARVSLWHLT